MSYFTVNGVEAFPPTGTVTGYLGTSDPAGWVIADGVGRPNTNNMYNNIANKNIGSITNNNTTYTPPNFQGAFLRGIGTATNTLYAGPTNVNVSQDMGVMDHSHGVTVNDPGHTHGIDQWQADGGNVLNVFSNSQGNTGPTTNGVGSSPTGISVTVGTVSTPSPYSATETRPYNYGVNWIIKL